MLDLLVCECVKLRRRGLPGFAAAAVFIPAAVALLFAVRPGVHDAAASASCLFTICLLQMPLLIALATRMLFAEVDCGALKSVLAVPVSRTELTGAKLSLLLAFSTAASLAGGSVSAGISLLFGPPVRGLARRLGACAILGALCFFGAMPCIALLVRLNRGPAVRAVLAVLYTAVNGMPDAMAAGSNPILLLPGAVIRRFLCNYYPPLTGAAAITPGPITPGAALALLGAEAAVSWAILVRGYGRMET